MTSNVAESLNASIRHVRKFPVCPLLESIHAMYQKWFYERRDDASRRIEILTPWTTDELKVNDDLGAFMKVLEIDTRVYQVIDSTKNRTVNLYHRNCTCRRFQLDLIPCAYAAAMYSGLIYPVSHPDEWEVPNNVKSQIVLPPSIRAQAGAPQTTRFPSGVERRMNPRRPRGVRHCSICGEVGHTKKRCPTIPIGVLEDEDYFSNDWN
ncbi:hypothetical protein PTKIN_Ptkin07bG0243700 [Pterospermum kingtungense]